jgi:hypothetical protein
VDGVSRSAAPKTCTISHPYSALLGVGVGSSPALPIIRGFRALYGPFMQDRANELPKINLPKLFGKWPEASPARFFEARKRPIWAASPPLGRLLTPDSARIPIFQTVSPRNPLNKGMKQGLGYPASSLRHQGRGSADSTGGAEFYCQSGYELPPPIPPGELTPSWVIWVWPLPSEFITNMSNCGPPFRS